MNIKAQRGTSLRGALERDPDWYRCNYMLAVAHSIVAQARERDPAVTIPDRLKDPKDHARQYVMQVATVLESDLASFPSNRGNEQEVRSARDFLLTLEPTVLILLAGVIRRWGWGTESASLGRSSGLDKRHARAKRFLQLVRGYLHRLVVAPKSVREPQISSIEFERTRLVEALHRNGRFANGGSERLADGDIIRYVCRLHLDYRARYNLACYYAGIGDDTEKESRRSNYDQALSELSSALRTAPADLVDWAEHDPSLAGLRADPKSGVQLRKLARALAAASSKAAKAPAKSRPVN